MAARTAAARLLNLGIAMLRNRWRLTTVTGPAAVSMCRRIAVAALALHVSAVAAIADEDTGPPASGAAAEAPPAAEGSSPFAPRARAIEEIVVTAQKKEQTLREVPISVSVVGDDFMAETGMTDFRDLSLYLPAVSVNNIGQFADIRIRGFGSPYSNDAFEQSVGLVIDGIPYTRLPYWQGPMFDLERVEVLRGPQGTLFGKNTTAGLFNVVTKKPTDEYMGYVDGELGQLSDHRIEAAIGGPIVAHLVNFRLAGLYDTRDGFVENTTARTNAMAHSPLESRDRKGLRAQIGLPNVFGGTVGVGYEYSDSATNGTGWEFRSVAPNQIPFYRYWDPNVDFKPNDRVGSINSDDMTRERIATFFGNGAYDLGGWGLNMIAGYSVLKHQHDLDNDFTPAPVFDPVVAKSTNPQTIGEVRLNSSDLAGLFGLGRLGMPLGHSDFTLGFFADHREITKSRLEFPANFPVLGQWLATDATGVVPPCPGCENLGDVETLFFGQRSSSYAPFAQMNWHPLERLSLEYGMRYTLEKKDADWRVVCTKSPDRCAAFTAALHANEFTDAQSISESAFTPKATLRYDVTDDANVYAGWGRGYKSGGFNATRFNDTNPRSVGYKPEQATSWELGTKTALFDRSFMLNASIFWQQMADLQVFVVTPDVQLEVANAGRSRSRGIELDGAWLPTDWLTTNVAFAFLDTKYLAYRLGPCAFDRPGPGSSPGMNKPCDLSGRVFELTPRWKTTVTPAARYPIERIPGLRAAAPFAIHGIDLTAGLTVEYKDNYYAQQTLDPRTRQPSFIRLRASFGIADAERGWSVRLVGENLTDETVAAHIRDVSTVGKSFVEYLDPPRLFAGQFRWQF